MITTTDIANIIYKISEAFEMPRYQDGNIPDGDIESDGRIVIHVKEQTAETYWKKGFAEVNLVVPNTPQKHADLIRLNAFERQAYDVFSDVTDEYDDTLYRIEVYSTAIMENKEMESHYVNVRLLVKVLNTI